MNSFKEVDFLGITENGKYSYTKQLTEGGFSIEIFDTKQHSEHLSTTIKHYVDMYLAPTSKPKDYK